ncbi:MAG: indolepyruvate oxidoreductase subunit beta [Methanobrevibacter sp.]|nr:indolepyruvate oxidoreductase subunit beta [Methanobrevibacter sp.]
MLNKENSYNIYICGVGGQGIIKTSVIIGEAAMNEGYEVILSEIHGMSQRGGVVSTELKLGGYKSSVIEKNNADIILAFEPIEAVRALDKANEDTKIVFNTSPIIPSTLNQFNQNYPDVKEIVSNLNENFNFVYPVEAEKLAIEAGSLLALNMVLLGATVAHEGFPISKEAIIKAMKNNLNSKFHEMNLDAIEKGYNSVID